MKKTVKFGWIPDLPDKRDLKFSIPKPRSLPSLVDLIKNCSPVEDQGAAGSCVGNSVVGNMEFLMIKNKRPFIDLSRLFAYYNARLLEGSTGSDAGAYIRDAIKALKTLGVCSEKSWPYDVSKVTKRPSIKCYLEALNLQIQKYERLNSLDEMKTCLSRGFPFVFGFSVYESFMTDKVAKTGTAPMPKKDEKLLGGHAVCCVGYADSKKRVTVRNSWGTQWGKDGYFTLPYAYLEDRNLSDDFWTITAGEQM